MANSTLPIVIIGTGLAGYTLAREIRKLDKDSDLLLITADDGTSYSKPMLSTGFTKNKTADDLAMSTAGAMAEQLNAVIRTNTRVTQINTAKQQVLVGEEIIEYSQLVLAGGATPIAPRVEGNGEAHIYSINDLQDYQAFRNAIEGKKRVAIMGAGLIGCEFANDLSNGDYDVSVVGPETQILPSLLPSEAANAVQTGLTSLGVEFHLGAMVTSVNTTESGVEVGLSNGTSVNADVVISAIGLRPGLDLAIKSGIEVNKGIIVNRLMQTSAQNVYALGDCAEIEGNVLLYVLPLMTSARTLAKTLTGSETPVTFGAMPIMVKTPIVPVVVAPPALNAEGSWNVETDGSNVKALFENASGELLGFALTGTKVTEKMALSKLLPVLLA
jgi:rubredoxin-NAD+ reductase